MTLRVRHPACLRFLLLAAVLCHAAPPGPSSKSETGAVVITPPQGIPMAGYYSLRGSEGVHDDLYAKTLLLDDGTTRAAIISLDLISTIRRVVEEARAAIEKRTGIPGRNMLITATHSHTGPMLANANRRWNDFGAATRSPSSTPQSLPGKLADSVEEAVKTLTPVTASWSVGRCEGIAFNRRFLMVDGTVGWNAGKLNPRIIRPAGPVDPELPVLSFEADKRQPVAMFVNFPIHLDTVGGPIISADVPGVVSRILAESRDPKMFTLYATGCCGDINHVDISHDRPQKGFTESARIGSILAASVLRTPERPPAGLGHDTPRPLEDGPLAAYPRRRKTSKGRRDDRARTSDPNFSPKFGTQQLAKAYRDIDIQDRDRAPYEAEVQVITLGPAGRVRQPARRDLRRARHDHPPRLALRLHRHRRAGERQHRLHSQPRRLPAGRLRSPEHARGSRFR